MTTPSPMGMTHPMARFVGVEPKLPDGFPPPGSLSSDEASSFVHAFLLSLRRSEEHLRDLELSAIVSPDVLARLEFVDGPTYSAQGVLLRNGWRDAALALNLLYAGIPLPEDREYATGPSDLGHDWPNAGDNLSRATYAYRVETLSTDYADSPTAFVPKIRVTRTMQLQKWAASDKAWHVYNQNGEDLLFLWDPVKGSWTAGFNLQQWLDQHMQEIFQAWNVFFTAVSTVLTLGYSASVTAAAEVLGQIAGLEAASRGLAEAAAGGDFGQILDALVHAIASIGDLPGAAKFADDLKAAGTDVIRDVMQSTIVQKILPAVEGGGRDVSAVVAKALDVKKTIELEVKEIRSELEAMREKLVPETLQPFFDRALEQGRDAAEMLYHQGYPVPDYALSAWALGAAGGVLLGNGQAPLPPALSHKGVRGLYLSPEERIALARQFEIGKELSAKTQVLPGGGYATDVIARDSLMTFARQIEKKLGASTLEEEGRKIDLRARGYSEDDLRNMGYK